MAQATDTRSQQKFLSLDEERALISRWQDNSEEDALRELLYAYRPFMNKMARTCSRKFDRNQELVNDGYIAMIESLSKFEPQGKIRFISYARKFVRSAMLMRLHEMDSTIDIPRDKLHAAKNGRIPQAGADLIQAMSKKISLDDSPEYAFVTTEICAVELISQKQTISSWRNNLELAFETLTEEEREVMKHRLECNDANTKDIALKLGKSTSRVRALETRAMMRLKNKLISQGFNPSSLVTA